MLGTQCLEIGKDCTGYKTTLTWGVGVASRGKLRGLSLPIANSSKKATASGDDGKEQATSAPKRDPSPTSNPGHIRNAGSEDMLSAAFHHSASLGPSLYSPNAYNPTSPIPVPMPQAHNSWTSMGFSEQFGGYNNHLMNKSMRMPVRPNPLRRIQTAPAQPYEDTVYSTPSSAFSDSDYPSPRDFPATPEDFSIPEPYVGSYSESYPCPPDQLHSGESYGYSEAPRSYPANTVFSLPSVTSAASPPMGFNVLPSSTSPTTFADLLQCNNFTPTNEMAPFSIPQNVDQDYFSDGFSDSVSHIPSSLGAHEPTEHPGLRSLPPRTRFFLESFDKVICPLLVLVDDRRNPYRMHVMTCIGTNVPLQYAISALVINQTRRRRSSQRSLSVGTASQFMAQPSPEERSFRAKATEAFNIALKYTEAVSTDSILIALLVLCLLNLSENGFGKFKVGLAGIKRLLQSRERDDNPQSELTEWVSQWLIWLDIIAAVSVADQDSTSNDFFGALHISAALGSMEHLAHCQGRLYQMVARLSDWSIANSRLTPSKDFYGSSAPRQAAFDLDQISSFWSPLQQVQTRLNSFASHPNFHSHEADPVIIQHLESIFKHAATIYAEQQSKPAHQISSSPLVARLVTEILRSLAIIPANSSINQFLIWPLLVAGSECVDELDRETIRRRIAAGTTGLLLDSYNCSDVLTKVWALLDSGFVHENTAENVTNWSGLNVLGSRAVVWRQATEMLTYDFAGR